MRINSFSSGRQVGEFASSIWVKRYPGREINVLNRDVIHFLKSSVLFQLQQC